MPDDGSALDVAEGIDPLLPGWLEARIRGETPWPPKPSDQRYTDQFFETASENRKTRHRTGMRPEMLEISGLRSAVQGANRRARSLDRDRGTGGNGGVFEGPA
jgi:hypothetical protein